MHRFELPCLLALSIACTEPTSPVQAPSPAPAVPAPAPPAPPQVVAPRAAPKTIADAAPAPAIEAAALPLPKPPAQGCVLVQELTVHAGPARFAIGSDGAQVLLVSAGEDALTLAWWSGAWGSLQRRAELALDAPVAKITLLHLEGKTQIAWTDSKTRLWSAELGAAGIAAPRLLAEGVDRRFSPSMQRVAGELVVAFTRTEKESMHTFLARVAGDVRVEDVTPPGHGAAAGSFLLGGGAPSLVMLDAHAGVSPLLEVTFDAQGRVQPATVRTPVSQPYAPPALAVVALSAEHAEVAFTAIGRVAATAIGRVPLRRAEAPIALVPSKGYGELHLSAAPGQGFAVFALESSKYTTNDPARELVVKVVNTRGEGTPLELRAEESLSLPALTQGADAGEYWLAFLRGAQVQLARLACGG